MSGSGSHHHFEAVTALSPLQFQKQSRLQEARRLMLGEALDAAAPAAAVHSEESYRRVGAGKGNDPAGRGGLSGRR